MKSLLTWLWAVYRGPYLWRTLQSYSAMAQQEQVLIKQAQESLAALVEDHTIAERGYMVEIHRLQLQTEHDALMLQAYANWCAAHGCTPSQADLQHASGKRG